MVLLDVNKDVTACQSTFEIFKSFTLCCPQLEGIFSQGSPQTFSVYSLKKVSYNSLPKRLIKNCARFISGLIGNNLAAMYERPIRSIFTNPRLAIVLPFNCNG